MRYAEGSKCKSVGGAGRSPWPVISRLLGSVDFGSDFWDAGVYWVLDSNPPDVSLVRSWFSRILQLSVSGDFPPLPLVDYKNERTFTMHNFI